MLELTKDQRRDFAAAAHHLKPILQIGKDGFTAQMRESIMEAFNTRELLKVRALEACPLAREELEEELTKLHEVAVVRNIGKTYILYHALPDESKNTGRAKARKKPNQRKGVLRKPGRAVARKVAQGSVDTPGFRKRPRK